MAASGVHGKVRRKAVEMLADETGRCRTDVLDVEAGTFVILHTRS